MKSKRQITDIQIDYISLVKAGANGKTIIWKSANLHPADEVLTTVKFVKFDDEKHIVYGIVYAPDEVDSQGDFAIAADIEKAAYAFMKARKTTNIDQAHDFDADEGFVAESWIVKKGDPLFSEVGAWAVGIKVENDDTWALVKSGEIQGLSMAGSAKRKNIEKAEGVMSGLEKIIDFVKTKLQKDFNAEYGTRKMWDMYYALTDAIWKILDNKDLSDDERKSAIFESVEQFKAKLEAVDLNKQQEEPVMDEKQIKELVEKSVADTVKSSITDAVKVLKDELITELKPKEEFVKSADMTDQLKKISDRLEVVEKATPGSALRKEDPKPETGKGLPIF